MKLLTILSALCATSTAVLIQHGDGSLVRYEEGALVNRQILSDCCKRPVGSRGPCLCPTGCDPPDDQPCSVSADYNVDYDLKGMLMSWISLSAAPKAVSDRNSSRKKDIGYKKYYTMIQGLHFGNCLSNVIVGILVLWRSSTWGGYRYKLGFIFDKQNRPSSKYNTRLQDFGLCTFSQDPNFTSKKKLSWRNSINISINHFINQTTPAIL
jgi:hypothetical protein